MHTHAAVAVIAAATLFSCALVSCTDVGLLPGALDNLDIQLLSGSLYANLMPIVPPDPISCELTLLAKNRSEVVTLRGIHIPEAAVFLSSTNERLGTIWFSTQWDGYLQHGDQDTIRLSKVLSRSALFAPQCQKYVRLELRIEDRANAVRTFTVDSLLFSCVY